MRLEGMSVEGREMHDEFRGVISTVLDDLGRENSGLGNLAGSIYNSTRHVSPRITLVL